MSGILTNFELAASLRVLRALRTPCCATVLLTWPELDQRAYVRLSRAGYVEERAQPAPDKRSTPFRWSRIAASPAGLEYLRQIEQICALTK